LIHWLKALLFGHFKDHQYEKQFLEILGEKVREEEGREEDERQSQFVLDQAKAAQEKREKRDREAQEAQEEAARITREAQAAAAVRKYNLLWEAVPFMGVGGKKKYASKKRFSSRKIKSRHKHRVFRAKVKNSRRKSKKNKN